MMDAFVVQLVLLGPLEIPELPENQDIQGKLVLLEKMVKTRLDQLGHPGCLDEMELMEVEESQDWMGWEH